MVQEVIRDKRITATTYKKKRKINARVLYFVLFEFMKQRKLFYSMLCRADLIKNEHKN